MPIDDNNALQFKWVHVSYHCSGSLQFRDGDVKGERVNCQRIRFGSDIRKNRERISCEPDRYAIWATVPSVHRTEVVTSGEFAEGMLNLEIWKMIFWTGTEIDVPPVFVFCHRRLQIFHDPDLMASGRARILFCLTFFRSCLYHIFLSYFLRLPIIAGMIVLTFVHRHNGVGSDDIQRRCVMLVSWVDVGNLILKGTSPLA